jgi:hypothetical protein
MLSSKQVQQQETSSCSEQLRCRIFTAANADERIFSKGISIRQSLVSVRDVRGGNHGLRWTTGGEKIRRTRVACDNLPSDVKVIIKCSRFLRRDGFHSVRSRAFDGAISVLVGLSQPSLSALWRKGEQITRT